MKSVRKIRRSQLITPFGPGAIVDLLGESFVAEDAGQWRGALEKIDFPRLAGYLGVKSLKSPPAEGKVPYFRFPQWLFCFECRLMVRWNPGKETGERPQCAGCSKKRNLVPMRFVAACADGHLTDIDWRRWAHSGSRRDRSQVQCAAGDLCFEHRSGAGGGLGSLSIRCRGCDASRSLERLMAKGSLGQTGMTCHSTQPWQRQEDRRPCDKPLMALQRGASNVYFPTVRSAIDIPPDSNWREDDAAVAALLECTEFTYLADTKDVSPLVYQPMIDVLVAKTGLPPERIEEEVKRQNRDVDGSIEDIRADEWGALCEPQIEQDPRDSFITSRAPRRVRAGDAVAVELDRIIRDVILVERLREVRVLTEFSRYKTETTIAANISGYQDFLPAIEVFGEGYFLRLDEDAVARWEDYLKVRRRAEMIAGRIPEGSEARLPNPTARLILLHTFAHLLLRGTAFEAGYSTSSLRERLYVTPETGGPAMAGILIYTAAGDAEGTLGGLVRMGEPDRLRRLILTAIAGAQWCSLDPVCGESSGQGPHGLSLAACHACCLVPETSCDEAGNRLLDRRMLVDDDFGFFAPLAKALGDIPAGTRW